MALLLTAPINTNCNILAKDGLDRDLDLDLEIDLELDFYIDLEIEFEIDLRIDFQTFLP